MPTVRVAVVCFFLPASLAVAVAAVVNEWGRTGTYQPRSMVYMEASDGGQQKQRLVIYHGPTQDCEIALSDQLELLVATNKSIVSVTNRQMSQLIDRCQRVHAMLYRRNPNDYALEERLDIARGSNSVSYLMKNSVWSLNMLNRILIFPGTKWCGQGSVAEHYEDLGYHAEADRCCRSHDLCLTLTGEYMSPGHCRKGLCNNSPVTRSPCGCDKAFVKCLKEAKTRVANALGKFFFNVAGLTCYKFDYPIKRCVEYVDVAGSLPASLPLWIIRAASIHANPEQPRCRRYELDFTKPKKWQFFENVYDDAYSNSLVNNARIEEARSHRRGHSLNLFQRIVFDVFMSFIDPHH